MVLLKGQPAERSLMPCKLTTRMLILEPAAYLTVCTVAVLFYRIVILRHVSLDVVPFLTYLFFSFSHLPSPSSLPHLPSPFSLPPYLLPVLFLLLLTSSYLSLPLLTFPFLTFFYFFIITDYEDITTQIKFAFPTSSSPKRSILEYLLYGIIISLMFPCLVITCIYFYRTSSKCQAFPPESMRI